MTAESRGETDSSHKEDRAAEAEAARGLVDWALRRLNAVHVDAAHEVPWR